MGDIKFACPNCKQNIQCDELWGGHSLPCPSCQNQVTVPQVRQAAPPAPAAPQIRPPSFSPRGSAAQGPPPPPSAQSRLTLGRLQHGAQSEGSTPARSGPVYRDYSKPAAKKSGALKWLKIAAVLVVLGVGGYFGFIGIMSYQEKVNAKRREAEKNSDGGELGHIANVYQTLEATDPNRPLEEGSTRTDLPGRPRYSEPGAVGEGIVPGDAAAKLPEKELPLLPAVWTLDAFAAKIPEGRANGKISGTNFVAEIARLDVVGTAHVLRLTQGAIDSPERELLIYLHPKAGSSVFENSWTITKNMKGSSVPQIIKRWKTDPRYAPRQKNFASGYAMKLELGPLKDGTIPGKIFVALPDPEKTVVAGLFKAATSMGDSTIQPTPVQPVQPVQPRLPVREGRPVESRYGISTGLP